MKRKISFGIAVLMILATCLLVSCNSEVSTASQANDGKLVYATFDQMSKAIRPSSSSMTVSYELYNIDDLYWVYTATKTDGAGTTGQTDGARVPGNDQYKGLGGAIGPFSKGTWTFTVEGYLYTGTSIETMNPTVNQLRSGENFSLIYVGTADGVVLNVTNDAENPKTIDITVYLQTQGGIGTLKIAANSKFFWAATGEGGYGLEDLKLKVYDGETLKDTIDLYGHASAGEGHAVYYSNSDDTSIDGLASGDHVFKVQVVRTVNDADQVFFEGTVNAKIYAGITTALDTQAIEGLFTYAEFNGTIDDSAVVVVATDSKTITEAGSVSFTTNYTPASGINPSTSTEKTTVNITGDNSVISAATYNLGVETSNIIAAGSKFSVASGSTAVASVDLTLTKTDGSGTTTISTFGTNGAATVTTYIAKNLTNVKFFYEDTEFTKVDSTEALVVNKFYYEGSSGKLVFMTSHFSEFYVTSEDEAYNVTQGRAIAVLSVDDSIHGINDGDNVILLKDVTYDEDHEVPVWEKAFDLNLNGKTFTTNSKKSITQSNNGYLATAICFGMSGERKKASVSNGTIRTAYGCCIYSAGSVDVTINNVDLRQNYPTNVQATDEYSSAIRTTTEPVVVINNGVFYAKNAIAVSNSGGDVTINGGSFTGSIFFNTSTNTGVTKRITINNGVFKSYGNESLFKNTNKGTLIINGGSFSADPQSYVPGFEAEQEYTNSSIIIGNYTVTRTGEGSEISPYNYTVSANN